MMRNWMAEQGLADFGQGGIRPERKEMVTAEAKRNFIEEAMRLNFLTAYGQGIERKFLGFSSALDRWKRRLRRRYRWVKSVKKR